MPAPSIMDCSRRWASKLTTVKRPISNNASGQLVAVGEKWESNGAIVYSPPSYSLPFLPLYCLHSSPCSPQEHRPPPPPPHTSKEKKKSFSDVILSFTIHFIWRLTNSIRVILCALHGCCRGERWGGLPGKGEQAPNTNKRARLCLPCPMRWEGDGAK